MPPLTEISYVLRAGRQKEAVHAFGGRNNQFISFFVSKLNKLMLLIKAANTGRHDGYLKKRGVTLHKSSLPVGGATLLLFDTPVNHHVHQKDGKSLSELCELFYGS